MASSVLEIWKMALAKIGNTNFPSALTDQTSEAQVCNAVWPTVLATGLAESYAGWKFATKRATLAASTETREGWLYVFAVPSDLVKVVGFSTDRGVVPAADLSETYDIEANAAGDARLLLTNSSSVELVYVSNATSVGQFTGKFTQAIATALAAELALAIKKDGKMAEAFFVQAQSLYGGAVAEEQAQVNIGPQQESQIIRARR